MLITVQHRGSCDEGVLVESAGETDHLEAVGNLRPSPAIDEGDLVAQEQLGEGHLEVTHLEGNVLWLDSRGEAVEHVVDLGQLDEILEVTQGSGPPGAVEIHRVGRTRNRKEGDRIPSHRHVALTGAGAEVESARRRRHGCGDQVGIDEHVLFGFIHPGSGLGQKAPGFRMQDPDPDLGQDPDGGLVDGLDLIVGQDPGRLEGVDEVPVSLRTGRGRGPGPGVAGVVSPGLGSDRSEHP